jgi:hypothetical protein
VRIAFVLALAVTACWQAHPPPQTSPAGGGSATPPASDPTDYPPAAFKPPTTGLAVGVAAHLVIDDAGSRIFLRKANGIDIIALDSGTKTGHIDIGWDGEIWPAGPRILALRVARQASIDVALVDPNSSKVQATCTGTVAPPPNSMISSVDEFTTHAGTTFLQWITTPPPRQMGGARVSDEQMAAMKAEFQAAYSCGLFAIHISGARCTLDVATAQEAGIEACGTRSMPWNRYLPSPIGKLSLRVDRSSAVSKAGLYVDTDTLVISELGGSELWRLDVITRATPPPPP